MCSVSLLIKYFVDRFCLMRVWKRAPGTFRTFFPYSRLDILMLSPIATSTNFFLSFPCLRSTRNKDFDVQQRILLPDCDRCDGTSLILLLGRFSIR